MPLLTQKQLNHYHENGFLVIESLFSSAEIAALKQEMLTLADLDRPGRVLEENGAVRSIFAPHACSEIFDVLVQMPRLVEPAQQILESDVYLHQYKLNPKVALEGEEWKWHRDFLYWHKEDGMPEPRALNVVIFLDEVNDFNGPMLVIPGSHRQETVDLSPRQSGWKATLTADLKYQIDRHTLAELLEDSSIVSIKGAAGFVLLFHCNLFHASARNLSPWDRLSAFITYNSVENTSQNIKNPRPEFIASRDFTPVQLASNQALMALTQNRDALAK
ncbi:MAG: phytanoyl-CoA dioxygenase family protein [Cyanobacteria bacterium P01_F01_bin.86]